MKIKLANLNFYLTKQIYIYYINTQIYFQNILVVLEREKKDDKAKEHENIFVLLMVHSDADFMSDVFNYFLLGMIIAEWQGEVKSKDQFIRDLTDLLT